MVLALDAENEKLRVAMRTLKDMIFGKRSERFAAFVAEQLALELDDLVTGVTPPAPANDDAPATKPPASPRKKARRNIGALPKHLPRCERVLEPDATACPCCDGRLHKIGEDVSEVLDVLWGVKTQNREIFDRKNMRLQVSLVQLAYGLVTIPVLGLGLLIAIPALVRLFGCV